MEFDSSQKFYNHVEKSLSENKLASSYLVFGEEAYLVHQATQFVKAVSLEGVIVDFNFTVFQAAELKLENLNEELSQLPMMSSRRVVLIKDVHELDEKEWVAIIQHLKSLTETHLLILSGAKLDRRKKSVKEAIEICQTIEYKKPFENQIPGWVVHIGRSLGLQIDQEVAEMLAHQSSGALFEIDLDLKKVKDFILPRTRVEKEDLVKCLDRRREQNVFELIDRLACLDTVEAFQKWMDLTLNGQSEVAVVSLLARHLRILAKLRKGQSAGMSGPKLAAFAGFPPFYLQDYMDQLKNWPLKRIGQCLELLAETDKALKSSPVSHQIWIENLIFKITESPKSH